ncbi:MAG: hypothetical protein ACLGIR_11210 [Actinomycetes bacterium]
MSSGGPEASPGGVADGGAAAGSAPPAPRAPRRLAVLDDPAGDQGLEGPGHADLRRVELLDEGAVLRVVVTVGAALPSTPAQGEVIGLGVDLLAAGDGESAYQLFVDGGSDGWRAYLQTPRGFVDFPGTFALGGTRIEVRVPWSALGDPVGGPVSAFLDWSLARPVLNAASRDRAPDRGSATFRR